MDNLVKFYENDTDIMYTINSGGCGLVSIPKDLKNNIKVYMIFKDIAMQEHEKRKLMIDMQSISKLVNEKEKDALLIVFLIGSDFLLNENVINYGKEQVKIKELINNIYNKILKEGTLKKENFIKKVEIISLDNKYIDFTNWLCMQNPLKFHSISYQKLLASDNKVFTNQNTASIFNEPNKQSTIMGMQSNIRPTEQSLSIGTPNVQPVNNPNNHPVGYNQQLYQKSLVKNGPNNHGSSAFIKWYTALFILLASLVIGIISSLILLK